VTLIGELEAAGVTERVRVDGKTAVWLQGRCGSRACAHCSQSSGRRARRRRLKGCSAIRAVAVAKPAVRTSQWVRRGHVILQALDCEQSCLECRQASNFDQQPAPKGDDPVVMYPPSSYRYSGADTWSRFDARLAEKVVSAPAPVRRSSAILLYLSA